MHMAWKKDWLSGNQALLHRTEQVLLFTCTNNTHIRHHCKRHLSEILLQLSGTWMRDRKADEQGGRAVTCPCQGRRESQLYEV